MNGLGPTYGPFWDLQALTQVILTLSHMSTWATRVHPCSHQRVRESDSLDHSQESEGKQHLHKRRGRQVMQLPSFLSSPTTQAAGNLNLKTLMTKRKKIIPKQTKFRQGLVVVTGGTLTFFGLSLYRGDEKFYRNMAMPAMRMFSAETAHNFAIIATKYNLMRASKIQDPVCMKSELWGHTFPNPVGVAAGFDKQGEAFEGLARIGFGFVEVGSVTPEPQPGNPKPRVFRLVEDKAVINRYGFNSDGHQAVYKRLDPKSKSEPFCGSVPQMSEERNMLNINLWTDTSCDDYAIHVEPCVRHKGIIGVNLGKNKTSADPVSDYVKGVEKFGDVADYLVINVSSPNTPGLRDMQGRKQLEELLDKVVTARDKLSVPRKPPVLVKIAPDLTEQDKQDIAAVVTRRQCKIDGLIVSNTTVSRPLSLTSRHQEEKGGLSGPPLRDLATSTVRDMYTLTRGSLPIIGVGGINSGEDAYEKIRAGASLLQLYTALVYEGPPVVRKIKRELEVLLKADGFSSISEAVGADHRQKK